MKQINGYFRNGCSSEIKAVMVCSLLKILDLGKETVIAEADGH